MRTLHKGQKNELFITEINGNITVQTRKEKQESDYYMEKQQQALKVFKLVAIGAVIAFCLLVGYGIIKIF